MRQLRKVNKPLRMHATCHMRILWRSHCTLIVFFTNFAATEPSCGNEPTSWSSLRQTRAFLTYADREGASSVGHNCAGRFERGCHQRDAGRAGGEASDGR